MKGVGRVRDFTAQNAHGNSFIVSHQTTKAEISQLTDKELERYTEDFDREQESRAQLVRLADRRKKTA